jgi:hypothetical protein
MSLLSNHRETVMSTIRAKTATTASRTSLARRAVDGTAFEGDLTRLETSIVEGVLMSVIFLGLLGATVALALSTVIT